MIGHLIAGVLAIVSGFCLIGYYAWANKGIHCSEDDIRSGKGGILRKTRYAGHGYPNGGGQNDLTEEIKKVSKYCNWFASTQYRHLHFVSGGVR